MKLRVVVALGIAWISPGILELSLADWPQWRYNSNRSAESPNPLPRQLRLQWSRQYPARIPTWEDPLNQDLMSFDRVFEPVVLGHRLFIGFNDRDKLVALDTRTGRELWTFYADGPVRLAPAGWNDHVYFVSDDGCLYCLKAETGQLAWSFRAGPSARKALGNGRVISAWPARGGPVIRDGIVYFAGSIWPFMGTFIYALDARDGKVVWVNDGTGPLYIKQPHSAPAFAGVAPQGSLVATRDFLLVPGGRSVPAGFDRKTGRFLYFQLEDSGKGNGGSFVAATESEFYVHTRLQGTRNHDLKTGKKGTFTPNQPVFSGDLIYSGQPTSALQADVLEARQKLLTARETETDAKVEVARTEEENDKVAYKKATNSLASAKRKLYRAERDLASALKSLGTNYTGPSIQAIGRDKKAKWELKADATFELIKAGQRLYGAGSNGIVAVELPESSKGQPRITWELPVAPVFRLVAADNMLFAVTLDGRILAFGSDRVQPTVWADLPPTRPESASGSQGYALWFGVDDGELLQAVLEQSDFRMVAVEPDASRVEQLRRKLDAAGLYGHRVTLHEGEPESFQAPPFIATMVVVGESLAKRLTSSSLKTIYESVRPYGGTLWISATGADPASLRSRVEEASLPQAKISMGKNYVIVNRPGPLPGAADWTHQYGDVGNSLKSDDRRVRLPLGVLWFGGNSHTDVLPRHGHGPSEQVAGGRLYIEGTHGLSARDVYTGRVLWRRHFADMDTFGVYYDGSYTNLPLTTAYNQKHIAGANARGANFVVADDAVYIVISNRCEVLDPENGRTRRVISLPDTGEESSVPQWGYLGVYEDVLLAGSAFGHYTLRFGLSKTNRAPSAVDLWASRSLIAFERHTGELLWQADARHSFVHNGIVAGNGRIYCLDRLPKTLEDKLRRRGQSRPSGYRIASFEARTGELLWETTNSIFGTWLGYSAEHDILLQAGASATDRLRDEAERGMAAFLGTNGSVVWKHPDLKYTGPCILHNDLVLTTPTSYKTNAGAFGLLDGKPRFLNNPLTGQSEPWRIYRTYGCNYPVASEYLLTFRSGAAGLYDLERHSGTGNLGGYKSGCSPNLIVADGVLNSPDYTRTCSCPYQNQTSLALVHMPELEWWTHTQFGVQAKDGQRIKRLGINFGAPGDYLAPGGTLWLDHPSVGGSSPNLFVQVRGSKTNYFLHHISQVAGEGPAWVFASGVRDVETILIGPETRRSSGPPPAPTKKPGDEGYDKDEDVNGNGKEETSSKGKSASTNSTAKASTASTTKTNKVEPVYRSPLTLAPYTVRLFFAEPESVLPAQRLFDVQLQGLPALWNFDVVAEAGGPFRGVIKEFPHVMVKDLLTISFKRKPASKLGAVICGVEMILEESMAGNVLSSGD